MAAKRKTWFAILGLLSWQPMSGYDIKKMIEMALSHFWSESYGQLFPTLNRLVEEGLATKKLDDRGGRRIRHVYSITAKGRRDLDAWFAEPTELPRIRDEHKLKFFLSSRRPAADGVRLIEEYRTQQKQRLELYKDSEQLLELAIETDVLPDELVEVLGDGKTQAGPNQNLMFYLTLRHGIRTVEARLAWCDEARAALTNPKLRSKKGEKRS